MNIIGSIFNFLGKVNTFVEDLSDRTDQQARDLLDSYFSFKKITGGREFNLKKGQEISLANAKKVMDLLNGSGTMRVLSVSGLNLSEAIDYNRAMYLLKKNGINTISSLKIKHHISIDYL